MGEMVAVSDVHRVMLQLEKRAENKPEEVISKTFVDAEPLVDIILAPLSQIMFGRRGTGKTHVLKYCLNTVREQGGLAAFIDIRTVGSNGSFYANPSIDPVERGLALVNDILRALHYELYDFALLRIDQGYDATQITLRMDDLSDAIGRVRVVGEVETTEIERQKVNSGIEGKAGIEISTAGPKASASAHLGRGNTTEGDRTETVVGQYRRHIDFAGTQMALSGLLDVLNVDRMWMFLDEWSETPRDIQPYLADLIRKTILPLSKIVVKIGAIEQRSAFSERRGSSNYIGLELGADISADLSLDDFLVFDYDEVRATNFFRELIYRNFVALGGSVEDVSNPSDLMNCLFTEKRAVEEFIRAVEGVPRDALNLMAKIVLKAYSRKAGVDDVRRAALDWYTQDKVNLISSDPRLMRALNHIVDEIIGTRRARAFLFPSGIRHPIIDSLFDARVLHLLKKNISSRDEPGRRYDAWKIDYGCYVDLIRTQKAPLGLLPAGEGTDSFVDVPSDDYRSIRRAVLLPEDLDRFSED
jgi:hypothetical protein